jgi:hypothetical protein
MNAAPGIRLLGSLVLVVGLGGEVGYAQQGQSKPGPEVTLGNLKSRVPAGWVQEEPTTRTRAAQFRISPVGDDKEDTQVVVFYFGENGAGSIDANIKRWKGMFIPPEGKTIDDVTKTSKLQVNGEEATYVDIHGTYLFKPTPFAPAAETSRRPNHRMLNAILPTKKGPYYIRMVGPADTMARNVRGFEDWVKGFK